MTGHHTNHHVFTHSQYGLAHVRRFQQFVALLVNDLALIVGHVIVFQQLFTDVEVTALYLALGIFYGARHPWVLYGLAVRHIEFFHDGGHAIGSKNAQQLVFQGQIESARTAIALTTGTAA